MVQHYTANSYSGNSSGKNSYNNCQYNYQAMPQKKRKIDSSVPRFNQNRETVGNWRNPYEPYGNFNQGGAAVNPYPNYNFYGSNAMQPNPFSANFNQYHFVNPLNLNPRPILPSFPQYPPSYNRPNFNPFVQNNSNNQYSAPFNRNLNANVSKKTKPANTKQVQANSKIPRSQPSKTFNRNLVPVATQVANKKAVSNNKNPIQSNVHNFYQPASHVQHFNAVPHIKTEKIEDSNNNKSAWTSNQNTYQPSSTSFNQNFNNAVVKIKTEKMEDSNNNKPVQTFYQNSFQPYSSLGQNFSAAPIKIEKTENSNNNKPVQTFYQNSRQSSNQIASQNSDMKKKTDSLISNQAQSVSNNSRKGKKRPEMEKELYRHNLNQEPNYRKFMSNQRR